MVANKKNEWLKNFLRGMVEGVKATPEYIKEKVYSRHDKATSEMMSKHGLVEGIVGAKNYDTIYGKTKGMLGKGDQIGAYGYIKDQAEKVRKQKEAIRAKR